MTLINLKGIHVHQGDVIRIKDFLNDLFKVDFMLSVKEIDNELVIKLKVD